MALKCMFAEYAHLFTCLHLMHENGRDICVRCFVGAQIVKGSRLLENLDPLSLTLWAIGRTRTTEMP